MMSKFENFLMCLNTICIFFMKTLFITSTHFSIDLLVFLLLIFQHFLCNSYCKYILLLLPFLSLLYEILWPCWSWKTYVVFVRVSNTSCCDIQSKYFIGLKHESVLLKQSLKPIMFSQSAGGTGGDSEPCHPSKEWLMCGSLRFCVENGSVARWKESGFWGFKPSISSCSRLFELWFPSCPLSGTLGPVWSSSPYTCVWESASRQK